MNETLEATSSDDAIAVLRATRDGDDLSSSDLALLELVVNRTISGLTPAGVDRWRALVSSAREGTYTRPWLHGVENLTRAPGGSVYWRGIEVEHFTYSDAEAERRAAVDLGLACSRLEAVCEPVGNRGLFQLWDRARWASDVPGSKRWVAFIVVTPREQTLLVVDASRCETIRQCQDEVIIPYQEASDPIGRGAIRTCLIGTTRDFELAVLTLRDAFSWARRAYNMPPADCMEMEDQLRLEIAVASLPTYEESFAAAVGITPRPERMTQGVPVGASTQRSIT